MKQDSKIRVVNVDTPVGKRELTFVLELRRKNGSCCGLCPYEDVCGQLPHPGKLDDPVYSFADFCREALDPETTGSRDFVPKLGTLEQNLSDVIDPFKILVEKNRHFPLTTFIDHVCSGICADYDPEHTQCSCNNKFCLLRDLFDINNKSHVSPDEVVSEGDTDAIETVESDEF